MNNNSSSTSNREYTRISSTPSENDANSHDIATQHQQLQQHQQQQSSSTLNHATTRTLSSSSSSSSTAAAATSSAPSRTMTEKISDKLIAAVWVVLAGMVFHYTDSGRVYFITNFKNIDDAPTATGGLVHIVLMKIVAILLGINTVLFLYLVVYLPFVKGLNDSSAWEMYCPRIIPTMTIVGICIFVLLIRATYPIWGFLAPIIISIEAMGLLFATHFIPIGL